MAEVFRPRHQSPNVLGPVLGVLAALSTLPAGLYALQWYLNLDVNAAVPPTSPPQGPVQPLTPGDLQAIKQIPIPLDDFGRLKQDLNEFVASQDPNGSKNAPPSSDKPVADTPALPRQLTEPPPTEKPPVTLPSPKDTPIPPTDEFTPTSPKPTVPPINPPEPTNPPTEPLPSATPVPPTKTDTPTPVNSATPTNSPTQTEPKPSPTVPATNTPKPPNTSAPKNTLTPQEQHLIKLQQDLKVIETGQPTYAPRENYNITRYLMTNFGMAVPYEQDFGFQTRAEAQELVNWYNFLTDHSPTARAIMQKNKIRALIVDSELFNKEGNRASAQLFQSGNQKVWVISAEPDYINNTEAFCGLKARMASWIQSTGAHELTRIENHVRFGIGSPSTDLSIERQIYDEYSPHLPFDDDKKMAKIVVDYNVDGILPPACDLLSTFNIRREIAHYNNILARSKNPNALRTAQLKKITLQQQL